MHTTPLRFVTLSGFPLLEPGPFNIFTAILADGTDAPPHPSTVLLPRPLFFFFGHFARRIPPTHFPFSADF